MTLTAQLILLCGSLTLALAAYPSHFEVGYGFVNHGGITPHGHYLPGSAKVKIHKDPFQSIYTVDEEGPTHYKYVRHSTASDPILHHHHGFGGHHHGVIGGVGPVAAPVHGGLIGGAVHGVGVGYGHGGGFGHGHGGHGHGGHFGGLGHGAAAYGGGFHHGVGLHHGGHHGGHLGGHHGGHLGLAHHGLGHGHGHHGGLY